MKSFGLLVLLMACHVSTPVQSSRAVLGRELSEVVVNVDVQPAALDVVSVFAPRGYALTKLSRDEHGITLRLAGDRRTVAEHLHPIRDTLGDLSDALNGRDNNRHYAVVDVTYGSAFYVRLEPRGDGASHVQILGRAIRAGIELCTDDAELAGAPCDAKERSLSEMPGVTEAEVIEGVFDELRLRGIVTFPERSLSVAAREDRMTCLQRRRDHLALAGRVTNDRARANILSATPRCE
jgi:hypothetical protein